MKPIARATKTGLKTGQKDGREKEELRSLNDRTTSMMQASVTLPRPTDPDSRNGYRDGYGR